MASLVSAFEGGVTLHTYKKKSENMIEKFSIESMRTTALERKLFVFLFM
jgi:hypothetical protein